MLRPPQFSIAQIMGFTFVIAVNVWAFIWDVSLGFWMSWGVLEPATRGRFEPAGVGGIDIR